MACMSFSVNASTQVGLKFISIKIRTLSVREVESLGKHGTYEQAIMKYVT